MLPDLRKFIVPCGKPDTIPDNFSDQEVKNYVGTGPTWPRGKGCGNQGEFHKVSDCESGF